MSEHNLDALIRFGSDLCGQVVLCPKEKALAENYASACSCRSSPNLFL
jgi:hypothetical protein